MTPTETLERAEALLRRRDVQRAQAAFDLAERGGADADRCAGGRWMTAMLLGDFEQAWRESDAIRARGREDPNRFWLGQSLAGSRVIVRSLHGYGDAVQMFRYAPALKALARSVVYEVAPRLLELAGCFDGVDQVIAWEDIAYPVPPWELQLEVMELPYAFRTTLSQLPIAVNYLRLPEQAMNRCFSRMSKVRRTRIGLVWSAGEWNKSREIPLEALSPLLGTKNVEFWSLDHGGKPANLGDRVRDATAECGSDLIGMAATIANLDLVITVDTLAAHLAGALGRPVWVMLQHTADWRWMMERRDSPWYPTTRLFRQRQQGDWCGVVEEVNAALKLFLRERGRA